MNQPVVFAVSTCTTADPATGLLVRLNEGEAWAKDDPFVKARPELFSDAPLKVRRTAEPAPVETATRTPGERKAVKRAQS